MSRKHTPERTFQPCALRPGSLGEGGEQLGNTLEGSEGSLSLRAFTFQADRYVIMST